MSGGYILNILLISPFNAVFNLLVLLSAAVLVVSSIYLRKKSERTREIVLSTAVALCFVYFWFYKYSISQDLDYARICFEAGISTESFVWWSELPLHLCNINLMLLPIAVLTRNNYLKSFCFYTGPIGALMGLLMPPVGFDGYSLLLPRVCGFYVTHLAVLVSCIALASLGLYRPGFRKFPAAILSIIAVDLAVFAVNMILRLSGIFAYANYFYNISTDGNAILDLFYNVIPIPFLYQLGCFLILIPYMCIVTGIYLAIEKISAKRQPAAAE